MSETRIVALLAGASESARSKAATASAYRCRTIEELTPGLEAEDRLVRARENLRGPLPLCFGLLASPRCFDRVGKLLPNQGFNPGSMFPGSAFRINRNRASASV